jgi:membrane-bound metal-dependent hydrolase YbcI (DUF457 family)
MRRSLGCLAVIALADYVIHRHPPRWHAVALFDHPAHVATAIVLGGTDPVYLAGSLVPDLDHIPTALGDPQIGDPRPNTHSLLVVGAASAINRKLGAGAAAHFVRDLAMDPGVPLLWPLSKRRIRIPYALYAATVIAAAVRRAGPGWAARSGATSARATGSA